METDSNNNVEIAKSDKTTTGDVKHTLDSLNLDCFLMILDHCDAWTLMNLCDVNQKFRNKVCAYKSIFASKLFDIDEYTEVEPIFEEFGQFIGKLDVSEYSICYAKFSMKFNSLLKTIKDYSVPGNLTEFIISFDIVKINKRLLNSALPYFANLKHFSYNGQFNYSHAQEHVLNEIIGNAHQLTSLDVRYLRTAGNWFGFKHLKNLERLNFLFVELIKFEPLRQFIQNRPPLRSLALSIDTVHHQHLCKLITKYIPNVEEFEIRNSYAQLPSGDDFDFSPYPKDYKRNQVSNDDDNQDEDMNDSGEEEEDEVDNDDMEIGDTTFEDTDYEEESDDELESNAETDPETDSDIDGMRDLDFHPTPYQELTNWTRVYFGLNRLKRLKRTWLKSRFSNWLDLSEILKDMTIKNTVEHLTIQVGPIDDYPLNFALCDPLPKSFTALKTLRIISPKTQLPIRHFVQALPNLSKFILDMEGIEKIVQETILNVIVSADNLEILVLKMPAMNFDHHLYMKLLGIQFYKSERLGHMKPLNIYINSMPQKLLTINKLKENYDEKMIAIKYKSFMDWETNPI
ncbi:uncharacterized protein LOC116340236 isoform X2 [Contarinia nasturtii]|nr:uncharacterized protein LOC116340236 isoform X2 [Contarinia nasturtii]